MKKIINPSVWVGITCLTLIIALSSFVKRGGDSYTISVNGKQIIEHYVFAKTTIPTLTVQPALNDQYSIYYSECGKIGTSRKLSIRNGSNQVLKEWSYANSTSAHEPMHLKSSDLKYRGDLALYYTSDNVQTPRKLVELIVNETASSSRIK